MTAKTASKLIGKTATITDRDHWMNGDWGVIVWVSGDEYGLAMFGDETSVMEFNRDQFRVRRAK